MHLEVKRYSDNNGSTLGLLFINGRFECYTLEDQKRLKKIENETRIPNGSYTIDLRTSGGFHNRYSKRFSKIHKGMLHIKNVPGFKHILIHCGNTNKDTSGCLLVGNYVNNNITANAFLGDSTKAYKKLYTAVIQEFDKNRNIKVNYTDIT